MGSPQPFEWTGEVMRPLRPKAADKEYVVGQVYTLVDEQPRSSASHRHFFATVHEAWQNLPDEAMDRFATSEHLRKWCLVKAGYRDERSIVCSSKAEARKIAAFVKPMDPYAVVAVRDAVVIVMTAKSQSTKAMRKDEFQKSKDDVLQILSELLGVQTSDLSKAAAA